MGWGQPYVGKQKMPLAPKWESCLCDLHEQSVPQFPHLSSGCFSGEQSGHSHRVTELGFKSMPSETCPAALVTYLQVLDGDLVLGGV